MKSNESDVVGCLEQLERALEDEDKMIWKLYLEVRKTATVRSSGAEK